MLPKIRVAVSGARGRMGREVCRTVLESSDLDLVGAFDVYGLGESLGLAAGEAGGDILVEELTRETLPATTAQVMVDFSTPMAVMKNIELALACGVHPVVGTTGISQADLEQIRKSVNRSGVGTVVAPNFALGAVLMMKFSASAARFFAQAEVIELHHDKKIDAPSGTALKTAEMIAAARTAAAQGGEEREEILKLEGARGGILENVHIHSVRLSGLIAHQMVIFGGLGQTLTIRHDSYDRSSFMPGVVLAVKHVAGSKQLIYGLENLLDF